ncbi:conserved hypothetical protein [Talaromyces stipitatus ATCC 10500]|uniref:Short-chain dehydrogenases/reductase n=1 Tax=Talaromyces stipitatus (strain ATCC 10500 / CBS 375.48 / QM 6759 / NRRL 1006) TaxID=441959 RepID=B8LZ31_TALSN|nr:uncharacterized protein TSTA_083080 [Talaromyces stipitatus ATCC 10500]EED21075.1 conserved hypothetical protein [Talaromyces stipitatus ATCC 10500]
MVVIPEINQHITTVKNLGSGLVAVFGTNSPSLPITIGGTSGIGLSTAREFTRYAAAPHVYLIGRNEAQASEFISELNTINESATVSFIKSDVSVLKNVDVACQEISKKESKVNLLFLSAGIFTTKGRTETSEGIDKKLSLHYYSRVRFIQNLLPHLSQAASSGGLARVISVLGPSTEGKLIEDDLDLRTHYSLTNAATHAVTMTSLSMIHLATANPTISFIHSAPGGVKTNLMRDFNPLAKGLVSGILALLTPVHSKIGIIPVKDSGERHVYAATHPAFAPREEHVETMGADGEKGSGAYRVHYDSSIVESKMDLIKDYLSKGTVKTVWDHTLEVINKATGN